MRRKPAPRDILSLQAPTASSLEGRPFGLKTWAVDDRSKARVPWNRKQASFLGVWVVVDRIKPRQG